jgi:RNA polymerase sigma-70 factor (ECF subfamily)
MEETTEELVIDLDEPAPPATRLRQPAFEDFYRIQREPVFRALALTLRDRELAGEAVDEAMARAYQHWRSVSGYDNQPGWAYTVGLNWARTRMRMRKREIITDTVPDRAVEIHLPRPELDRVLAQLDLRSRAVVVLRYYLDWSYEDIAAALRIPLGTVKSRLHRALAAIKEQLEEKP